MKRIATSLVLLTILITACHNVETKNVSTTATPMVAEGDSTIYGIACDGCTDTVLVFLRMPYEGTDPDTFNILEATRQGKVLGKPRVGSKLAIVRNDSIATSTSLVIVTEGLIAQWCYRVKPTLRPHAGKIDTLSVSRDSLRRLLSEEREYGYNIKDEGVVYSIGLRRRTQTEDESPVVYPELQRYREWHIYNGRLVLTDAITDSIGNQHISISDTADIVVLGTDTLVLRFSDSREQSFYRKKEEQ